MGQTQYIPIIFGDWDFSYMQKKSMKHKILHATPTTYKGPTNQLKKSVVKIKIAFLKDNVWYLKIIIHKENMQLFWSLNDSESSWNVRYNDKGYLVLPG